MSNASQEFNSQDTVTDDILQGGDTIDNSYTSRSGQTHVPVVKDETPVEQPNDRVNPDLDEMLSMSLSLPFLFQSVMLIEDLFLRAR
jgi:hypothetical protein